MLPRFFLSIAFTLLLISPGTAAAQVPTELSRQLQDAGLPADVAESLELPADVADALASMQSHDVEAVIDGVTAIAYQDDESSLTILVTRDEALGEYKLPSGRGIVFQTAAGEELALGAVLDESVVFSVNTHAWTWVEPRLLLSPAKIVDVEVTGASVDESAVQHTLRVDPNRDDALPTIGAAIEEAKTHLNNGEGVRISIAPGIYREGNFNIPGSKEPGPQRSATLVIEGDATGEVVITGADDWTGGWVELADAPGIYARAWPHKFGLGDQTWARWNFLLTAANSRSEVVAVDGQLMMPVDLELYRWVDPDGAVSLEDVDTGENVPGEWKLAGRRSPTVLEPGTFGVDEQAEMIYVCPPEGVDPNETLVEVAVRQSLLDIYDRENLVLRNLTFQHCASYVGGHDDPVDLSGRNILVEHCAFIENGARGLSLGEGPTDITLRNCTFSRNGWLGLAAGYKPDNYLIDGCVSNSNNWRGHFASQHSWDAAAMKFFGLNGQVGVALRNHRSFGNLTHGVWFDQSFTPRAPIEISDSLFAGNYFGATLYLEKLTGPVDVERNVVWNDNGLYGVNGTSWNMHFRDNVLYAGNAGQPVFFLHNRGEESEYAVHSKDWTM
ncbi:MAG: right-handed parallel beta-helix repeat-containing protein, partial [Planctomycetota bacterium]